MPNSQWFTTNMQNIVELTQTLSKIPSESGCEENLRKLVLAELRSLNVEVWTDELGTIRAQIPKNQPGRFGQSLCLVGNLDHCAVSTYDGWIFPPYGGVITTDTIFGRGVCDPKGPLTSIIFALKCIMSNNLPIGGNLDLILVPSSCEAEGVALKNAFENEGLSPDFVLVIKPTNLRLATGHQGRTTLEMSMFSSGDSNWFSTHSDPTKRIATLLYHLQHTLDSPKSDEDLGTSSWGITGLSTFPKPTQFAPESCVALVERKTLADEDSDVVLREFQQAIQSIVIEGVDLGHVELKVRETDVLFSSGIKRQFKFSSPAWHLPKTDPSVEDCLEVLRKVNIFDPPIIHPYMTEASWTAGELGIPTVIYGPGDPTLVNTKQEQVKLSDLATAAKIYTELVQSLTSKPPPHIRPLVGSE